MGKLLQRLQDPSRSGVYRVRRDNEVLDALREGFKVRALSEAMRAVNLNPADGAKAIDEMRQAGAEIVGNENKAAEALPQKSLD